MNRRAWLRMLWLVSLSPAQAAQPPIPLPPGPSTPDPGLVVNSGQRYRIAVWLEPAGAAPKVRLGQLWVADDGSAGLTASDVTVGPWAHRQLRFTAMPSVAHQGKKNLEVQFVLEAERKAGSSAAVPLKLAYIGPYPDQPLQAVEVPLGEEGTLVLDIEPSVCPTCQARQRLWIQAWGKALANPTQP